MEGFEAQQFCPQGWVQVLVHLYHLEKKYNFLNVYLILNFYFLGTMASTKFRNIGHRKESRDLLCGATWLPGKIHIW